MARPPMTRRRRRDDAPIVRKNTIRLPAEVARRVRLGHPWVYREALGPLAVMLESMWSDALWRLKLASELRQTRRGPQPRSRPRRSTKGRR